MGIFVLDSITTNYYERNFSWIIWSFFFTENNYYFWLLKSNEKKEPYETSFVLWTCTLIYGEFVLINGIWFYWILFKGRIWWLDQRINFFLFLLHVFYTMHDWFAKYQEARICFRVYKKNCFAFFLIPMSRIIYIYIYIYIYIFIIYIFSNLQI